MKQFGLSQKPADNKGFNWLRWLLHLIIALIFFYGVSLLLTYWLMTHDAGRELITLQAALENARPWLVLWRLGLFTLLIGGWEVWVSKLAARYPLNPPQRAYLVSQRWRVAGCLLLFELLFVQNGLALLVRTLYNAHL